MRKGTFFVFLAVFLFAAGNAPAQVQTGSITGTIQDAGLAVIPNANIAVEDTAGKRYTAKSSEDGTFTVPGLPFGFYKVSVEVQGFQRWESQNVQVVTAQPAILRVTLQVGEISETVRVEGSQQIIDTASTEISSNVTQKQILDLPLVTRNPMDLVALQAGVSGRGGVRSSVFNGLRGNTNNVTHDGINVQDNFLRDDGFFAISAPTVENTGEFSISSQNIGSSSGAGVGQVRIVTPRGTNELHGSVFYFHRNDFFNANSWENNLNGTPREREREHRFGGRVGGPVFIPKVYDGRDRTLFFFRYEGFRENETTTRNRTVLTQEARNGIFRYNAICGGTGPACPSGVTPGQLITVDLLNSSTRGFGPNPFTMSLINATPLSNNTQVGDGLNTSGFEFNAVGKSTDDRLTLRVDQKLAEGELGTHWLEVSWNRAEFNSSPDTFNNNEAAFPENVAVSCVEGVCEGADQVSTRQVLAVAIQSTLSPTMFNEFRFGFNRAPVEFVRDNAFPRAFRINFPGAISDPENRFLDQGRIAPVYQFSDNLSKIWGDHTFQAGFLASSTSVNDFNDGGIITLVNLNDAASSTNSNTSNSEGLASSLFPASNATLRNRARAIYSSIVGLLGTTDQTFNAADPAQGFVPGLTEQNFLRERAYSFYFEDGWQMRSNLRLNYGVRYELIKPVDVVNKRAVQPVGFANALFVSGPLFQVDPNVTFNDFLTGTATAPQVDIAGPRSGVPLWRTDKDNWAPFLGAAWSVTPKTVIRSGFSVSFTRDGLVVAENAITGNDGLTFGANDPTPNATLGASVLDPSLNFALPAPALNFPLDGIQQYLDSGTGSGLFTFDRNLRTPYVLQWSFGIQRELWPSTALEVRYVGNHAVKLIRGIDVNQIDLFAPLFGSTLLDEFVIGQNNLAICEANRAACTGSSTGTLRFDNRGVAGQQALPILEAMNFPFFTSSTFTNTLGTGEAGQWAHDVQRFCTFFFFFDSGGGRCAGLASFPANFFRANPFATFGDSITNFSHSNYHGLQVEVRRRFTRGLFFQGNYTLGKVLTDFSGSAAEFDAIFDLRNPRFERSRATFDVRHVFRFNSIWELPVGRGRQWASGIPVLSRILEGWQVGGIWTWQAGPPVSIVSNRGTLNRAARSTSKNTAIPLGLTPTQVCNSLEVNKTANGAFLFPESFFVRGTGTGTTGADFSVFDNPAPGSAGPANLRNGCSGLPRFQVDMNFLKRTPITERINFEFRAEFFNIFNNVNFSTDATQNINGTGFAVLDSTFTSREIQLNARINW